VVRCEGLGDLEEPDQLEPVQALRARLVGEDLGEPGVDGGIWPGSNLDVGEPEEPANAVHHGVSEETRRPLSPRSRMSSSMCAR